MAKFFTNVVKIIGGAVVGFINGFLGGGGGMLAVPLLTGAYKEKTKTAHATAVLVILPISIASGITYFFDGHIKLLPLLTVGGGVIVGGIIGALLLKIAPQKAVAIIFAVLMLAAGVKMAFF